MLLNSVNMPTCCKCITFLKSSDFYVQSFTTQLLLQVCYTIPHQKKKIKYLDIYPGIFALQTTPGPARPAPADKNDIFVLARSLQNVSGDKYQLISEFKVNIRKAYVVIYLPRRHVGRQLES